MATLILTAVGGAIGGPIGGAIGSILGQRIDQSIFAPKARHGPRLGDLAVQTSSYGVEIPKLFGMMRVAGTVIWATDLIESRSSSGGGKGRPKTISYSYSANFAVALSGRRILGVRRIWADGKLLRGSAGDFKTSTEYRLYQGDEDQPVDPMIAAAEGTEQAPAFRGLAYAVFEHFQLEDYGNRIPSLTFEVEADAGPVAIGDIAEILSDHAIIAGPTPALTGYAASGGSARGAVEALADVVPLTLADRDGALRLSVAGEASIPLFNLAESGRRQIVRRAAGSVAGEVSIAYYDIGRDYQTGLQRATAGAPDGRNVDRRGLAAALSAEAAKALAEFRLSALRLGRTSAKLSVGWSMAGLRPGDRITLTDEPGLWEIKRWTLGQMTVALELSRTTGMGPPDPVAAAPGTGIRQPDLVHGATLLRLFDLPLGEPAGAQPVLLAAAAGASEGWRRAALLASFDDGASWQEAGSTAPPAVLGDTLVPLGVAGSALFDLRSSLEIQLLNDAMWLESADDAALAGGANLALIGDELIQFGGAQWLGSRRFLLSRLLRGRRGTEWAIDGHEPGEPFTLIERETLAAIEAPVGAMGGEARLLASGVGDVEPASASRTVFGRSLRPPSPVHLRAARRPDGDIEIGWVRRSRGGWAWPSEADTPLAEESECYRLILSGVGFQRTLTLDWPSYVYTLGEQVEDGLTGTLTIAASQIGTHAMSIPALVTFE